MSQHPNPQRLSSWKLARAEFSPLLMLALVLVSVVLGGVVAVNVMYAAHAMDVGSRVFLLAADVFFVGALIGGAAALAGGLGYLIAHAVGARHLVLVAFAVGVPGGLVTGALARDSAGSGFGYPFAIAGCVVGVATFTGLVLAKRALRRGPLADELEEQPELVP